MHDFITIQEFMRKDLKLSGNELLVYAIIYGFSKDGESKFYGSRQYLADWCGISVRQVQTILNKLVDYGLLTKYEDYRNKNKNCQYVANFTPSEKISPPSEEISPPSEKTSLNNIDNNLEDSIDSKTNTKVLEEKVPKKTTKSLVNDLFSNEELKDKLIYYFSYTKGFNYKPKMHDIEKRLYELIDMNNGNESEMLITVNNAIQGNNERPWFKWVSNDDIRRKQNQSRGYQQDYWSKRDTQQSTWAKDEDINYDDRY